VKLDIYVGGNGVIYFLPFLIKHKVDHLFRKYVVTTTNRTSWSFAVSCPNIKYCLSGCNFALALL